MIQFHLGRDAKAAAEVVATHAASWADRSTIFHKVQSDLFCWGMSLNKLLRVVVG